MEILFNEISGHKITIKREGETSTVYLNEVIVYDTDVVDESDLVAEAINLALQILKQEGKLEKR